MKVFSFLAICLSFLASCTNSKTVSLEAPQKNELNAGDMFTIQLPENHTTGYMWQLNNSYNNQITDYLNSVWHGNEKGVYFNFKAKEKGTCELNFALIKYKDTLERKTFIINVK